MVLTGRQKAAMLLMGLDVSTASEMLKGFDQAVVQDLAVEAAYLEASGLRNSRYSTELAKQFCSMLQKKPDFEMKNFLKEMLKSTVGEQKAEQIQNQLGNLLAKKDPFMPLRSADTKTLVSILEKEHPQAIAVVLSEVSTKKSSEILGLLHETIRLSVIRRMIGCESISPETKVRIAETVCKRLDEFAADRQTGAVQKETQNPLRKIAIILRNLGKELRDGMLAAVREKDQQSAQTISELMIIWEDIPLIADRSLQTLLRGIDAKVLALAFVKADEAVVAKIKTNISERAVAAIDEETSLMSAPKKEDIEQSRQQVVKILREANEKGEIAFAEG